MRGVFDCQLLNSNHLYLTRLDATYIKAESCKVQIGGCLLKELGTVYSFPRRSATILSHTTSTLNKKEIKKEGYLAQFL